jgi:solute carrier family 35 protein E1
MVSLGAGPVSFTHIVKAMEPFFSALVSALLSNKWMPWYVYATLLPVVGGVGYASYKETNFSWLAFGTAMGSNLAFALRAVLSKVAMTPKKTAGGVNDNNNAAAMIGTALTPANVFGLVTCAAFWISIPLALIGEGSSLRSLWKAALTTTAGKFQGWWSPASLTLWRDIAISGFFHYMNNEVMYLALDNVHPVTLAVGNTMKRVFIMVAAVMFFQNTITFQSGLGAAVGIAGVLLYSLTLHHYTTQASLHAAGVKA